MTITVRAIDESEFPRFQEVAMQTFGGEMPTGELRLPKVLDAARTYAAFDRDELVGTAGAFGHTLTIPGGSIPMAGLTLVCVRPTHRRRGVLRAMMARHEEDMIEHGEAISGLWASESAIYPRFGYGLAAEAHVLDADAHHLRFPADFAPDSMHYCAVSDAVTELAPLHQAYCEQRPGVFARTLAWWQHRVLNDGADRRGGASSMRIVVASRNGEPVGYVMFRQRLGNDRGVVDGSLSILELIGLDRQSEQSLWHFISHIDLYPSLTYWNAPLDCALPWLVMDRRRVRRLRTDTLWLHLRDIPAALSARHYACDGLLRIAIDDENDDIPTTRIALQVENGQATCQSTQDACELQLRRQDLSSLYLGAFRVAELAGLGRVHGSAEGLALADAMFTTSRAPWCPERF